MYIKFMSFIKWNVDLSICPTIVWLVTLNLGLVTLFLPLHTPVYHWDKFSGGSANSKIPDCDIIFWKKKGFMFCPILSIHPTCLAVTFFFFLNKKALVTQKICFKKCFWHCHLAVHEYHSKKHYMNKFKAWINRLKLCMSVKGEHFECNDYNITKIPFSVIFVTTMILFIEHPSYIYDALFVGHTVFERVPRPIYKSYY